MEYKVVEIKVGLVICVCMAMLAGLLVVVGGRGTFRDTYEVKARFSFTDGLENNAPVRFAGVEVGKVTGIRVIPESGLKEKDTQRVEATLRINDGLTLRRDSIIRLSTLGLMGTRYVSISPGTVGSPPVSAGETLQGEDPLEMSELMAEGKEVISNLKNITDDLGAIISANKGHIDETIVNMRNISKEFSENLETVLAHLDNLLNNADSILSSNREDIREAVENLRDATRNAKDFSRKINEKPNALIWGYKEKKPAYREKWKR